jgi:small-conductance mechanosensitive channel
MLPRPAVAGSPSGFHSGPPAAVLRLAPLPPLWIAVSLLLGWPASVAALGLLPVGAYAAWRLARSRHLPTAAERRALAAATAVLGLWLVLQPLPVIPELRGVLDRLAGLAVAGLAALALLRVPTGAILEATDGLRLPVVRRATSFIAVGAWRAAAIAAIGFGLVGTLGYTALASVLLARLAGTFFVVVAVVGLLVATESLAARAVLAIRRRRTGGDAARLRREVVRPLQRILAVAIVLVGVQALVWMVDRRALPVELVGVAIILATLPFGLQLFDGAVRRLVQREGTAPAIDGTAPRLVFAQRAVRALVVLTSAVAVIALLGVDLSALASPASFRETVARSALDVLIVVLMADLAWHTARASIERKELQVAATGGEVEGELARRRARLRTLLPIMRNILGIVILVTAALMALSSIGIEIGPLIAGAGVVGVAIGFGAQTLVRDVIAGVFFLLDDAFRVGEYIESGELRGTVEAFSLRSVKLRHHRGKLHTVPFGELGSVTNYSRDWVIDKLTMKLALDTDVGRLKRVVKQVGGEMMQDPELAQVILQPPKSQGVQAVGEGGVEVSIKVMTRPGEQFVVRRALYQKLMAAFRENDIHLATPTLRVAGDATAGEAAAQAMAEGLVPRGEAEAARS